jgi:Rrf2 family protein
MSTAAEYAIQALIALARSEKPMTVAQIARQENLPVHYTAKLLQEIGRRGILTSRKGPVGGFALAVPAEGTTIADVLDVLGRPPIPSYWQPHVVDFMEAYLRRTTLADLARAAQKRARRKAVAA